jgi:hypothetical protein
MASELEDIEIPVPCPGCGNNTLKSLKWLKANDDLTCSICSETVHLDDHGFRDALRDAEKSVARLRKES